MVDGKVSLLGCWRHYEAIKVVSLEVVLSVR
jgi:hypothetical protein